MRHEKSHVRQESKLRKSGRRRRKQRLPGVRLKLGHLGNESENKINTSNYKHETKWDNKRTGGRQVGGDGRKGGIGWFLKC